MAFSLRKLPQQTLIGCVRGYRLFLSPWLGASCRFYPTCSAYSIEALERHGALWGSGLTAYRILRCNPWCQGGHDGVPEHPPKLFSRLLRRTDNASRTSNPEASS